MARELKNAAKKSRKTEDDMYKAVKADAKGRSEARKSKYSYPPSFPPVDSTHAGDGEARTITREIEKNRGLTPHRSKEKKNPRKKHRLGYAKAQVRRKGQVQDVKKPSMAYAGEETGIKTHLSKSRRL